MFRRSFLTASLALATLHALAAPPALELSRIERLIKFVEQHKDIKFVRNGSEYTSADAGKFLRGKLDSMGRDVRTAHEFIDQIASKSSMSGEPYHVKFVDGRTILASQFLGDELKRLEAQPA